MDDGTMSANRNSMERAWAAGRGILAVVGFAVVLSAAAIVAENHLHLTNPFLPVVSVLVAALVSVILVHGLGIFEGLGV
jgi:peptidoglycan/LPS O-acetylase OafA/YrhL